MINKIYIRIITTENKLSTWQQYFLNTMSFTESWQDGKTLIYQNTLFRIILEPQATKGKTHIYLIDKELTDEDKKNIEPSLTNGIIYYLNEETSS